MLLDEVDKELERPGRRFARYADDCNVYVRSRRAGERVMALLRRLYDKLRLKVKETKSAVASAFGRKYLDPDGAKPCSSSDPPKSALMIAGANRYFRSSERPAPSASSSGRRASSSTPKPFQSPAFRRSIARS